MLYLYKFINGYVLIRFSGQIPENIINICTKNGLSLWNVKREKKYLFAYISTKDFKYLRKVMRKSKTRAHIIKKKGLPFVLNRYRKRIGLPIGIAFFFVIIKLMSCFIWSIDVRGNKYVETKDILNACREIGIYEGVPVKNIDSQNQKQKLLLKLDSLAWASLNVEGCRITVNVTEIKQKKEDNKVPTNLKASADGVIKKIDVTSGNCVVKVGDTVKQGDILVSGVIERTNSTNFVHSIGIVDALTERVITVNCNAEKKSKQLTGKKQIKKVLDIFGLKIPLYLGKVKGNYKSSYNESQIKLFTKNIPIRLYSKKIEIYKEKVYTQTEDEINNTLEKMFLNRLKDLKIIKYDVKNREITRDGSNFSMKTEISAEENIALQDFLIINTGN